MLDSLLSYFWLLYLGEMCDDVNKVPIHCEISGGNPNFVLLPDVEAIEEVNGGILGAIIQWLNTRSPHTMHCFSSQGW